MNVQTCGRDAQSTSQCVESCTWDRFGTAMSVSKKATFGDGFYEARIALANESDYLASFCAC